MNRLVPRLPSALLLSSFFRLASSSSLRPIYCSSFIQSHRSKNVSFLRMSSSKVVVVGSANQDLVVYTPKVPSLGETVLGSDLEVSCGGKGANQAVAAASLAPTRMICKVGKDGFGKELLRNFGKECKDMDSFA